jgi:phosphoglycolate phosphatase
LGFDLYIFDLDGTLIDTRQDMTTAINEMLSNYALKPKSVEEVTGYVGDGIRKLVERCLGEVSIDVEDALSIFEESYWNHKLDATALYPGVKPLLFCLRKKSKAILTNKAYRFTKAITDSLGLTPEFSLIIGGDSVPRSKPSTDGVEYVLQQTGIPRERAAMVGDGRNDIVVAKSSGLTSVWATYGFCSKDRIRGLEPDYTIDMPVQLLEIDRIAERKS